MNRQPPPLIKHHESGVKIHPKSTSKFPYFSYFKTHLALILAAFEIINHPLAILNKWRGGLQQKINGGLPLIKLYYSR